MSLHSRRLWRLGWLMPLVLALVGCSAASTSPIPTAIPRVIVVTPTALMTRVPTAVRAAPTTQLASATTDAVSLDDDTCQAALLKHYTAAQRLLPGGGKRHDLQRRNRAGYRARGRK